MQISTARKRSKRRLHDENGSNGSTVGLQPSLPPSNHRGKGKLCQEAGEIPGLNLLSLEGFHRDQWHRAATQAGQLWAADEAPAPQAQPHHQRQAPRPGGL